MSGDSLDGDMLAEVFARNLKKSLRGVAGETPVRHLLALCVGTGLDAADGTVDRDVADGRFQALDHQAEEAGRLDEAALAGSCSREDPRFAARGALVPAGYSEWS